MMKGIVYKTTDRYIYTYETITETHVEYLVRLTTGVLPYIYESEEDAFAEGKKLASVFGGKFKSVITEVTSETTIKYHRYKRG